MKAADCERLLHNWIQNYCVDPNGASDALQFARPLREARIEVRPVADKPGRFEAVMYLLPYLQLEVLSQPMRVVVDLPRES
jgi:type VI secretion system protein ImpC